MSLFNASVCSILYNVREMIMMQKKYNIGNGIS
jgi:hypothetical protein